MQNYISIKEFAHKIGVSDATVMNWIKTDKIKPDITKNNKFKFSVEYTDYILNQLNSPKNKFLKSRRNKKYVSGTFFYKDYLSNNSHNTVIIEDLVNHIIEKKYSLTDEQIKYIIADCAIQMFTQCKTIKTDYTCNLSAYLNQELSLGTFNCLIEDLIDDKDAAIDFAQKYSDLFYSYVYEKDEDILGLLYISLSDLNNRKASGTYYTPTITVKKIMEVTDLCHLTDKKILDPCCGGGNFLLHLPDEISINQICGNDIDSVAISITRLNMALKFDVKNPDVLYKNFTSKNFLLSNFKKKFDYIIGNPPWGADFTQDEQETLKRQFLTAQGTNIESYDLFIEKSLSLLNQNGSLTFIVPQSILTVKNHNCIRNIILNTCSIRYLEFLGNMFNKVNCPSIILQICATNTFSIVGMKVVSKDRTFVINKERKISPYAFNFDMNDEEYEIYNKILSNPNNVYLKNNAIFALGIVTGNNEKYITTSKSSTNEVILKGSDIEKYCIDKPENYIEFTPKMFHQVAPAGIYRAKEKLLYKFISKELVFAYDDEQTLSLNSCNILIPQIKGLNIKYIMAILNSRVAQFVFAKSFNSVKVLRSHIESIPIPMCNYATQNEIIQIVDMILNNKQKRDEINEILEEKICKLYGLNKTEYKTIKNFRT